MVHGNGKHKYKWTEPEQVFLHRKLIQEHQERFRKIFGRRIYEESILPSPFEQLIVSFTFYPYGQKGMKGYRPLQVGRNAGCNTGNKERAQNKEETMKKYKVGDLVYTARVENRSVSRPCDVCFGQREVTLMLGNGNTVRLPCEYCGKGYESPSGFVKEYEFCADSVPMIIDSVQVSVDAEGEKIEYRSGHYSLYPDKVFDTAEEAKEKCEEICAALKIEQDTRAEYLKKDAKKSFAWNAGYHMRCVKKAQKEIEYHSSRAVLCKAKSKECAQDEEATSTSPNKPQAGSQEQK